jgi:hypothetical protein
MDNKSIYINKKKLSKGPWMNAIYQINDTISLSPKRVLLIGVGNGVVPYHLKNIGYDVKTIDFDRRLKPDIVGDVKDISKLVKNEKFDVIICAHVLEHLPFEHFNDILECFSKTAKYVVLQLPPSSMQVRFNFAIQPYLLDWNFNINIPVLFWKKYKFNGHHYWQPYRKNYSMKRIRNIIKEYFIIKKAYQCLENHYSYNFVLKSTNYDLK